MSHHVTHASVTAWLEKYMRAWETYDPELIGDLHPFVGNGNRAVAVGTCTYWTDATRSMVDRVYYNNWLLEFAEDGRCSSFTEYYMKPRAG